MTATKIRWPLVGCFEQADEICQCPPRERALRALAAGVLTDQMTAEQRADCLRRLGSEPTALNDREIARAVCAAEKLTARVNGCFDNYEVDDDYDEAREEYEISRAEIER